MIFLKNVSFRNLFLLISSVPIALTLVIGGITLFVYTSQLDLNRKYEARYKAYLLADELRQNSEDLTKMARLYVLTGDPKFEEYYNEILVIQEGKRPRPQQYEKIYWDFIASTGNRPRPDGETISLIELMKQAGFTDEEFAKLEESKKLSDDLVSTEVKAMELTKQAKQDTSGTMAAEARQLLHNERYLGEIAKIMSPIDNFFDLLGNRTLAEVETYKDQTQRIMVILLIFIVITIATMIFSFFIIRHKVIRPVQELELFSNKITLGDFNHHIDLHTRDEVGNLASAINQMSVGLKEKSQFVTEIGKGNLDYSFIPISEYDVMGISLLKMKNALASIAAEDKKRNWASEGTAKFSELLRSTTELKTLGDNVISNLVKYIQANQGSIFIVEDDDSSQKISLNQLCCYAFNRKKFVSRTFAPGQGLVGQAYLEGETIYLTQIPDNYITITSGLGEANPRSLVIVPMKVNGIIEGIIELASFREFEPFEIAFIEKVSENIASVIATAKINEHTRLLLEESQRQSEEVRAQEEEMRQNLEELAATQEEASRKEVFYLERIDELEKKLSNRLA